MYWYNGRPYKLQTQQNKGKNVNLHWTQLCVNFSNYLRPLRFSDLAESTVVWSYLQISEKNWVGIPKYCFGFLYPKVRNSMLWTLNAFIIFNCGIPLKEEKQGISYSTIPENNPTCLGSGAHFRKLATVGIRWFEIAAICWSSTLTWKYLF